MVRRTAVNPFAAPGAAGRYLDGRPASHERALERASGLLGIDSVARGLDVACGPGPSTRALASIADLVVGVDVVEAMVRTAASADNGAVRYVAAAAEELPFPDDAFDLLTVASGVHWFDQPAFCREARRVLRPDGWMVIYEHHFLGQMQETDTFETWMQEQYLTRYPIPPRGRYPGPDWKAEGFGSVGRDEYADPVPMTRSQLIAYFLTQSNTVVPVERGDTSVDAIRGWLEDELRGFFPHDAPQTLIFWGIVHGFRAS